MPNRFNNWTFREVESFLKDNGFHLHHTNGSHFYYIDSRMKLVCVPFHGNRSIKPRTIRSIILQSGLDKENWFEYG